MFRNIIWITCILLTAAGFARAKSALERDWNNPPTEARVRAYWWWLNGNVTKASITRDLEGMKEKGFGGAVIVDANGAEQEGNAPVPHGPTFFTPAWRELYKHALREAHRLGLEISLTIQSGWNLGGPMVTPEDAGKKYVWSETNVSGGGPIEQALPVPAARDHFYRDTYVVAYPMKDEAGKVKPLENWKQKALQTSLQPFSSPDTSSLFAEYPAASGEEETRTNAVVDITAMLGADGVLRWDAPPGKWMVIRFGYTIGDHSYVSTCSEGWNGYALDVYDAGAFERYWNAVVEPLIADAGKLAGTTLKYLHTDSWEIELCNWTPTLRAEFQKRRGYDMMRWLPALAGHIVNSRDESDRFLADYRKTLGDLTIDNHYRLFRDKAHAHGLLIHPEAGGPHAVPIDAQRCLGWDDAPMAEFWAWSWTHRIGDENRFFVKQPASAAHTYGHKLVLAEGFTDLGPHWQESLWSNLKPAFDKALCEGLNDLVWHAFVCSPESAGLPGQQYFAGTHLNPEVTWWGKSQAFFSYLDRCQALLQQGLPVADVLYYYGDHVPNFTQLKKSDPAKILPGYDYDVITEEALLTRASARNGRILLPDGMSYRALVLSNRKTISLPVLRKVRDLVAAGATVIGTKPAEASGLQNYPASDKAVAKLAAQLFDGAHIITNQTAREVLQAKGIGPDFAWTNLGKSAVAPEIDFIHRRSPESEIYFVANRGSNAVALACTFRIAGRAPELWDAVSGEHHFAAVSGTNNGTTTLPIHLNPCGSVFVVFREQKPGQPQEQPEFATVAELSGPWNVSFDPRWGGPANFSMDRLESWTSSTNQGVKYYSGTAVYRKTFEKPPGLQDRLFIDLGNVRELAEVKVNGHSCGITWTPPFRVDITDAVKRGKNLLEIEVINFWPNRIIGDQFQPPEKRLTRTNIRLLKKTTPLIESGLLGPVRLVQEK